MTVWWKISLIAAFLAVYGAGIWRVHTWFDASKELKIIAQETAATKAAMKSSSDIDTGFQASIDKLHQMELSANQQIEADHETPASPPCILDPHGLSTLRAAIAGDHPTR